MALNLINLAWLVVAVVGSDHGHLLTPRCVDSIVRFAASATNFDLSTGTLPSNATLPAFGNFGIQLRYCEPTLRRASRKDTLQILVHGVSYNTEYWDSAFQPETYSYVHFAAAQGYATLNMARLGYGKSDHPDPVSVVQTPLDIAVLEAIIKAACAGRVPGAAHAFGTVVYLGHSYGSILLNGLILSNPDLIDAAVFTGYSHDLSTTADVAAIIGLGPARDRDPARFGNLPPDYLTTANASSRAAGFYGPPGTFDPAALTFDEAHKDTTTTGEVLTLSVPIATAPQFKGDVFTVNGVDDSLFCARPGCANLASEGQFYPSAKSVEFSVVPLTGHSLNFHLSAPAFYQTLQAWLSDHGY